MAATTGLLSAADVLAIADGLGAWFKANYAGMGLGDPTETSTLAAKAVTGARYGILGNGTTAYPGISNADVKRGISNAIASLVAQSRYDVFFNIQAKQIWTVLDGLIRTALPSSWSFASQSNRALDLWATRYNANGSGVPATPGYTVTLTATTGGSIAPTTGSAEPRVKITLVGAYDWLESQPTAASAQVALSGKYNAYTLGGLTGNVPTGVTKLRVYRQLDNNAGSSDPYYWDQDVAVTAGVAWSTYTVTLTNPDHDLRQDITPPSWLSCLFLPEEAALYALSYASLPGTGYLAGPLSYPTMGFLSPGNVALNPINAFLVIGNVPSVGELARWASTTTTLGNIRTTVDAAQGLQGFAGGVGIQARVTSILNGTSPTVTVGYNYLDAAHPSTPQSGSTSAVAIANAAGSVADLSITAGRLVTAVTSITMGGSVAPTTGTLVIEGKAIRSI